MTSSSVWAQATAARQAFQTLVNEAGVVVADEGHQIKNPATKRFAAVTSLKTKRRIALTGYPLQNNMDEYYTMIMWCMDDLLGDAAYFHDTFSKPIQEGEIAKCIYLCISCCATIIPTASDTSPAVSMGNQSCIISSSRSISIMPCSGWTMEGLQGYPAQHTCCMPVIHSVQCALRSTCSESSKVCNNSINCCTLHYQSQCQACSLLPMCRSSGRSIHAPSAAHVSAAECAGKLD